MHFVKLDALRGISIMLVIIGHWFSLGKLHIANIGVDIFFVLSGFLITLILLRSKLSSETSNGSIYTVLKKFYVRRFLRIFPVYYLTLVLCRIFLYPDESIKQHFWWDIAYLNNIYSWFYNIKPGRFIHLWSLSVEEQFYLIWPLLVLFTRSFNLKKLFIGTILLGIIFRLIYYLQFLDITVRHPMGVILLPACVDLFAWGGLLAYYVTHKEEVLTTHSQKAFMISLIGFIVIVFCLTESPHILTQTIFRLGSGLLALGMIIYCLYGSNKFLDIVFSNRILIYIGKISYGLYLLHLLVLDSFFIKVYQKLIGTQPRFAFVLCARFTLLIFICSLSWYLFERPINNLKDKLAAY